jgi:hypothetical protein
MLIRSLATLGLSLGVYAGHDNILQGLVQLEEIANNKSIVETGNRAFQGFIADFLINIDNYGCWCYLKDSKFPLAKGPVQDGVDSECKVLVHGYRCAIIDAIARGETCDPQAVEYIPYNFFSSTTDLETECTTGNSPSGVPDLCKIDACVIEGTFTLVFFSQFFEPGGIAFDPTLVHPEANCGTGTEPDCGVFDAATECATTPGGGSGETECCGNVPARFPFKTFEGARACCNDKTYSTTTLKGCNNPGTGLCETVVAIEDDCPA